MIVRNLRLSALLFLAVAIINPACTPPPTAVPTVTPERATQTSLPTPPGPADCVPSGTKTEVGQVLRVSVIGFKDIAISVLIDEKEFTVRYIGIRFTERGNLGSVKQMHGNLVRGQEVRLIQDTSDVDQHGDLLRYVLIGDQFVNYELVRQGLVVAVSQPPDEACDEIFQQAMQAAQDEQIGMWAPFATPSKNPEATEVPKSTETASPKPRQKSAEWEGIQVTLSYPSGNARLSDLHLKIIRHEQVLYNKQAAPGVSPGDEVNHPLYSVSTPEFYNLDEDEEVEIVFRIESGKSCCSNIWIGDYEVQNDQYHFTILSSVPLRAPKFEDINQDGKMELMMRDTDFAVELPSNHKYVIKAAPIEVWEFTPASLLEVTSDYPETIRRDATKWWQAYTNESEEWTFGDPMVLSTYIAEICTLEDTPYAETIDLEQAQMVFEVNLQNRGSFMYTWLDYLADLGLALEKHGYNCQQIPKIEPQPRG